MELTPWKSLPDSHIPTELVMQVFGPKCNGCSDTLKVNPLAIVANTQTELIPIESNFSFNLAGSRDLSTSMRRTSPVS